MFEILSDDEIIVVYDKALEELKGFAWDSIGVGQRIATAQRDKDIREVVEDLPNFKDKIVNLAKRKCEGCEFDSREVFTACLIHRVNSGYCIKDAEQILQLIANEYSAKLGGE